MRHVFNRKCNGKWWMDDLQRLAILISERGAQHLVTRDDGLKGAL